MQGDKVVKRILDHTDQDVTSLYTTSTGTFESCTCLARLADRVLVGRKMAYVLPDSERFLPDPSALMLPCYTARILRAV